MVGPPTRVRLFGGDPRLVGEQVHSAWPDAEVEVSGHGPGFDVALVWDAGEADLRRFVAGQESLRWLHTTASGLPETVRVELAARAVVVTNGVGTHGQAVAEHVAALLLAHYKRLPALIDAQRRRLWQPPTAADEVRGKTVGVIGLGDLGQSIVRVLTALGADVLGLRRGVGPVDGVGRRTYRPAQLAEFLPQLDALVVAAPLTGETRSMIGAAELALLPRGAFVVNVGRGPIIRGDALVTALESGHLAGAALDVFDDEPLPPSSPLWSLPGVIVTPHCADTTGQTAGRCLALLLEQIRRFRLGLPLRNIVDLARGY